mmetsp:Transcript_4792/g.11249  ORF Transcript_4792/g.11249 Transcript_4792/m.11249 type:complete len:177 (-) Transcript_4792:174-704(-)
MGGKGAAGPPRGAAMREVQKPWVKQEPRRTWEPERRGMNGGKDRFPFRKGKGKGSRMRAAPLNSEFWERKVEEENREELGGVFTGTIQRYNWRGGWGYIMPDNLAELPKRAREKLKQAKEDADAAGKDWSDENLVYFRKPDVNHTEGFKLGIDVPVTFSVYVDDKGAGAYEVSMVD